ncbi:hypothetical protein ACIOJD_33190 [Streptomyces sp. NPDC088116]|uniref:hypothetical protein n=1 Tax=Streptomyces sp. NPDC088116 TaxID=3365825 RepID=UPI00380E3C9D
MAVEEVENVVGGVMGGSATAEGAVGDAGDVAAAETTATATLEATRAKRYPVAPGYRLNVRSGPGTNYRLVRVLSYNVSVPINCQKPGEWVSGPYGTTNIWDNIANGEYVSDAYVHTGSSGYVAVRCS